VWIFRSVVSVPMATWHNWPERMQTENEQVRRELSTPVLGETKDGRKVTRPVLESIPGHRIHTVQVNDGPLKLLDGVTIEENCFDRLWPGEGEFPLVSMLEVLARTGGLNQVAPEVFSPGNVGKSPEEIAKLSAQSIRRLLDKACIAYD
jgi:hypothetical protein